MGLEDRQWFILDVINGFTLSSSLMAYCVMHLGEPLNVHPAALWNSCTMTLNYTGLLS
jgi:hypothetical protein